jgi:hypothetical protein
LEPCFSIVLVDRGEIMYEENGHQEEDKENQLSDEQEIWIPSENEAEIEHDNDSWAEHSDQDGQKESLLDHREEDVDQEEECSQQVRKRHAKTLDKDAALRTKKPYQGR